MQTAAPSVRHRVEFETCAPDFEHDQPFSFLCNARLDLPAWTPERLSEEKDIIEFGRLSHVSVLTTTQNFDDSVIEIIEAWNERGYRVHLKFPRLTKLPVVGTRADPRFYGMNATLCYIRRQQKWEASPDLRNWIKEMFAGDRLVRVEA